MQRRLIAPAERATVSEPTDDQRPSGGVVYLSPSWLARIVSGRTSRLTPFDGASYTLAAVDATIRCSGPEDQSAFGGLRALEQACEQGAAALGRPGPDRGGVRIAASAIVKERRQAQSLSTAAPHTLPCGIFPNGYLASGAPVNPASSCDPSKDASQQDFRINVKVAYATHERPLPVREKGTG